MGTSDKIEILLSLPEKGSPEPKLEKIKIGAMDSVMMLARAAATAFSMTEARQKRLRLSFRKQDLSKGKISDYSITAGSTVHLVLGAPTGLMASDAGKKIIINDSGKTLVDGEERDLEWGEEGVPGGINGVIGSVDGLVGGAITLEDGSSFHNPEKAKPGGATGSQKIKTGDDSDEPAADGEDDGFWSDDEKVEDAKATHKANLTSKQAGPRARAQAGDAAEHAARAARAAKDASATLAEAQEKGDDVVKKVVETCEVAAANAARSASSAAETAAADANTAEDEAKKALAMEDDLEDEKAAAHDKAAQAAADRTTQQARKAKKHADDAEAAARSARAAMNGDMDAVAKMMEANPEARKSLAKLGVDGSSSVKGVGGGVISGKGSGVGSDGVGGGSAGGGASDSAGGGASGTEAAGGVGSTVGSTVVMGGGVGSSSGVGDVSGDGGNMSISAVAGLQDESGLQSGEWSPPLAPPSSLHLSGRRGDRLKRSGSAGTAALRPPLPSLPPLFPRTQSRPHVLPSQLAPSASAPELKWHNRPKIPKQPPRVPPAFSAGLRAISNPAASAGYVLRPRSPKRDPAEHAAAMAAHAAAEAAMIRQFHQPPPRKDVTAWVGGRKGGVGRSTSAAKLTVPPGSASAAALPAPAPMRDLLNPEWVPLPPRPPTRSLTEQYTTTNTGWAEKERPSLTAGSSSTVTFYGTPIHAPHLPHGSSACASPYANAPWATAEGGCYQLLDDPSSVFMMADGVASFTPVLDGSGRASPLPSVPWLVERVGGGWGVGVQPVVLGGAGPPSVPPSPAYHLSPASSFENLSIGHNGSRSGPASPSRFHNNESWHGQHTANPAHKGGSPRRRAANRDSTGWSPHYNETIDGRVVGKLPPRAAGMSAPLTEVEAAAQAAERDAAIREKLRLKLGREPTEAELTAALEAAIKEKLRLELGRDPTEAELAVAREADAAALSRAQTAEDGASAANANTGPPTTELLERGGYAVPPTSASSQRGDGANELSGEYSEMATKEPPSGQQQHMGPPPRRQAGGGEGRVDKSGEEGRRIKEEAVGRGWTPSADDSLKEGLDMFGTSAMLNPSGEQHRRLSRPASSASRRSVRTGSAGSSASQASSHVGGDQLLVHGFSEAGKRSRERSRERTPPDFASHTANVTPLDSPYPQRPLSREVPMV